MTLEDKHKQIIAGWVNAGMKLADIQKRMDSELGLSVTYMELRIIVNDLQVMPKDEPKTDTPVVSSKPSNTPSAQPPSGSMPRTSESPLTTTPLSEDEAQGHGGVSLTLDKIARPGAAISGQVTFSDGVKAAWYLDQMGRLGLVGPTPGYRPPGPDLQEFQILLEQELSRSGF